MGNVVKLDAESTSIEEFARFVLHASDEEVLEGVEAAGTQRVLERIFSVMESRYRVPEVEMPPVKFGFSVGTPSGTARFVAAMEGRECRIRAAGADAEVQAEAAVGLVDFFRLILEQVSGAELFMTGRLSIEGDFVLAQQVMDLFEPVSIEA